MNWESIKQIYRHVLVYRNKIEYLGEDRYKIIIFYSSGEKHWEIEYKNEKFHGKHTEWYKNGRKHWEIEYKNGKFHGKYTEWYKNGRKHWETEYKNGKSIK